MQARNNDLVWSLRTSEMDKVKGVLEVTLTRVGYGGLRTGSKMVVKIDKSEPGTKFTKFKYERKAAYVFFFILVFI